MVKKAAIGLTIAAVLMLSFLSSAALAERENKPINPSDLKNITFVHYAKPDKPPGKPDKPDESEDPSLPEPDNSYYETLGLYLPSTAVYYVNTAGAPDGALAEIQDSFRAWDDETSTDLFIYVSLTNASGPILDGQNTVSWRRIVPRSTIAITNLWYVESTGEIVEFDITFNAFLKWGIDPDDEGPITLSGEFDLENIAVHEVGHVVGLADLYEDQYRELTMYGYGSTAETIKISLEAGDKAGVESLYGP